MHRKLCRGCWRIIDADVKYHKECDTVGRTNLSNKYLPMLWSVFQHCVINQDKTLCDAPDAPIFDFIVPEYRLAIDVVGDHQFLPINAEQNEKNNRIKFDEMKQNYTFNNNWRWICLSGDVNVARNELLNILNEVYVSVGYDGQIKVLTPRLQGDAGWDLVCDQDTICQPHCGTDIPSQVYLEIPNHLYAIVQARSSTSKKRLLVLPGVIDPAYRGQVFTMTFNPTDSPVMVKKGDRISQLLFFHRIPHLHINPVIDLRPSERGTRGFGSTDVGLSGQPKPT